jgi:hypothetical protein
MTQRQLKLGLVPTGVGGPGETNRWLDTDIPLDASVNIDWYIDVVRKAEAAKFDLVLSSTASSSLPTRRRIMLIGSSP